MAIDRERYRSTLHEMAAYAPCMSSIPLESSHADATEPHWLNEFLPPFDAVALAFTLAKAAPATYLEIGSGESTKLARWAIRQGGLPTRIVSIDPEPRSKIDSLCTTTYRGGLETAPAELYQSLEAGDVLFFDGSHRLTTNSDVAVFFLEVLPALKPGVLVQIHDIYWPLDYPPVWGDRDYSEQYVLGACLLLSPGSFEILLPNTFVCEDTELSADLDLLWRSLPIPEPMRHGQSFWFTKSQSGGQ
ncbi:MAG TPA: class I SAM-dependent methyltransferase [Thermoanaerobaculia bacterium]